MTERLAEVRPEELEHRGGWVGRSRTSPWRTMLLISLGVALTMRLLTAVVLPTEYRLTSDAVEYVNVARHLLEEGVFGEHSGIPYATIPPGYPLFVAFIFGITENSLLAVRLVQVALGTLMVWMVFLIGRAVSSAKVGMVAAFILAVYPPWILWPSLILTETLFTFVFLAFVLVLLWMLGTPRIGRSLVTGVMFAFAILVRESLAGFAIFLPGLMAWSGVRLRQTVKVFPAFLLAVAVSISPWLVRNSVTFGTPFFSERIEAIRYQLTGHGYLAPRYQYLAGVAGDAPRTRSTEYLARFGESPAALLSVSLAVENPGAYIWFLGNRLRRTWLHPVGLVSVPGGLAPRFGYLAVHVLLLLMAVVGFTNGVIRRESGIITLVALVGYATVVLLFLVWPHPRYTLPFLPLVFVGAAKGVCDVSWWTKDRLNRRRGG